MASANALFDDILTSTLINRDGAMADNVSNHNSLLRFLRKAGNITVYDGGTSLIQNIDFVENTTFKWYSDYDVLDVSASQTFSAAEFDEKQSAVTITVSGKEMRQNAGSKTRVFDLVKARIMNADRTAANEISTAVYSDGTGSGGQEIGGLQLLVADDPTTGIVGGIDRANFSFWRNQKFDTTADGSGAATAANIQEYMDQLWLDCVRGEDVPKMIVADVNFYKFFRGSLTDIQRITSTDTAGAGANTLAYHGTGGTAQVMMDKSGPVNHMYFLNTDFLFFKAHRDANFTFQPEQTPVNQDAVVKHLLFQGNMTLSNASLQGVLFDA